MQVSPQWEKEDCLCDHDNVTWGKKRQRRNRNPKSATTLQVQPNCTHVGTNGPPVPSCGVNKRSLKPLKLKRNNSTIPSTTIPQLKKVQSKGFDSKQAETALMQSCSKECVYVRGLTKEGNSEKENSTVAPPNLQASTLCTQSQHHQTISHDKSRKTKNILCEVSNEVTVERMPSEDLFKKPKSLFCDITLFSQTEVVSHKNESIRHHITLNHTFQPALTSSPLDPSKSGPITDRIIPVPPNAAARGTVIKECSTDSVYVGNERPVDGLLSDDSASNQLNVIDYKSDSSNLNGNFDLSKSFSSLQITLGQFNILYTTKWI